MYQPGDAAPPPAGAAVTIGAYDGVHLGHREIIARVRATAADLRCASAVVTFDHHPATVVRPQSAPPLLTDLEQKLELLASTGVDLAVVVHFDEQRARESAEDFVRGVLVDGLGVRAVVVGHDFHFGYRRMGDVPLLQRMGAQYDFDVTGVHLYPGGRDLQPVSSTRIRALLAAGDVGEAAALLTRPHQVRGRVARGDGRGRDLGYPTANVEVPGDICLPADGVYAGWYRRPDHVRLPAAISLGRRPTFYDDSAGRLLEAYVLDFDGDLYGENARVEFEHRLRGQQRFDSVDGLAAQMAADVAAARRVLAGAAGRSSAG
jgi:riboflavin kinase/FMN adenylyltransferase